MLERCFSPWTALLLAAVAAGCAPRPFSPLEGPTPADPRDPTNVVSADAGAVRIDGTVLDERDGEPVPREARPRVRIPELEREVFADPDGRYSVDLSVRDVAGRTLEVTASARGFSAEMRRLRIPADVDRRDDRTFTLDFALRRSH